MTDANHTEWPEICGESLNANARFNWGFVAEQTEPLAQAGRACW
jgi:hypothetical protein